MKRLRFLQVVMAAGMASTCLAAQPGWIRYQGRLMENGVLANRPGVQVTFSLFDQPTGGTLLYREVDAVTALEGFYATDLGATHPSGPRLARTRRADAGAGSLIPIPMPGVPT